MPFTGTVNIQGSLGSITAANFDSGAATDGQVLTADGAGGSAWENAAGGGGSGVTVPFLGTSISNTAVAYNAAFLSAVGRQPVCGDMAFLEDGDVGGYVVAVCFDIGMWYLLPLSFTTT